MMDLSWHESHDEDGFDVAWSTYDIYTDSGPDREGNTVLVRSATNDDLDQGFPTQYASWDLWFKDREAALKHTGRTRLGVGHRVFVELNGLRV